ncbi:KCND2 [Branchiostoma lanceolatum]|uniref:KCND2 protein n=1 Tax=Branchiostoma lanceolatum TaxID=7740 RepID=A0A8J9ZY35_BRALA|nr:KCND2 [Branchiostoma lanceolatum]
MDGAAEASCSVQHPAIQPEHFTATRMKFVRKDDRVKLQVGGTLFVTSRKIFDRFPDSLLGSDEKDYFYNAETDEYVFDRDPDIFRYILTYYRTGHLHYPENESVKDYDNELIFFRLMAEDIVGVCCRETYMEKKEALEQIESETAAGADDKDASAISTLRARLWSILDDPLSGAVAQASFYVTGTMIVASIVANVVETIWCRNFGGQDEWLRCGDRYRVTFSVVEITCVTYFTIEYSLRLFAAPNRREFVKSPLSVIDLVSIVPFYIALCIPENKELNGVFVTLRVFRVFRIFKLSRSSSGMQMLGQTLKACMRDLGFLLFALAMTVVIFATMMYYCERGRPESNFTSIPAGFWYIVVTMTTLGYGDMVPNTIVGMLVTAFCCLSSVVLLTLPVTVIVSNFNAIYRPEKVSKGDKALLTGGVESPERERFQSQHQHLIDCLRNTARPGFYLTRLHQGSRDLHRSDASSSTPASFQELSVETILDYDETRC